jgi:ABC-type antimicrobial peptide transport system permease subunit
VTLLSGTAGAAVGTGLVFVMANWAQTADSGAVPPILVPGILVGIFLSVVAIGIVSGLLPAIRASRIEPAISLRA